MLIALEGIDGSGKSTLTKLLYDKLKAYTPDVKHYHKLSPAFDHPYVRRHMRQLRRIMAVPAAEQRYLNTVGERHWLFLAAAWFAAVQTNRIAPEPTRHRLLLMDGWYYRLIAKFLYKGGYEREWLFSLFSTVTEPDLVVLLDVDPALAWKRRPTFKPNEIGVYERRSAEGENSDFQLYCRYQAALRETLLQLAQERSWLVVPQDEATTADENSQYICNRVLKELGLVPTGTRPRQRVRRRV